MNAAASGGGGRLACPVCEHVETEAFAQIGAREYWRCAVCEARFLDPAARLDPQSEYQHYLSHENEVSDPGYRRFLSKLADPMLAVLPAGSIGLDYGCGPGPALAVMMAERGHSVAYYDPFFAPDAGALLRQYDFVLCSEVIEHFHDPAAEFRRLRELVRPGGWLGLMTCFQVDDARFATWHYPKDPTHVVFYREATLRWLASVAGWSCHIPHKDVALLQKPLLT
ncbi:MAG: class I SAM-dependent methyltransferase [Hyphomonas sp.]